MIDNLPDILVSTDWNHFRQKLVEESHGQVHPHHSYHPVMWTVKGGWPIQKSTKINQQETQHRNKLNTKLFQLRQSRVFIRVTIFMYLLSLVNGVADSGNVSSSKSIQIWWG